MFNFSALTNSWQIVGLFRYFSASHENRTDAAIELLARFDIVAVNKEEGTQAGNASCTATFCGQELHQIETLRRVKQRNPSVFTMAYMNSMMNFGSQAIARKFSPELLVINESSGTAAQFHGDGWRPADGAAAGAVEAFNWSLPAARQIWLDDLQMFLDTGVVDGLFADKGNNWAGSGHTHHPALFAVLLCGSRGDG